MTKQLIFRLTICYHIVNFCSSKGWRKQITISYANYMVYSKRWLVIPYITRSKYTDYSDCVEMCADNEQCQSLNYASRHCNLLNSTKHQYESTKVRMQRTAIYLSLQNRGCDESKCQNNATCIPIYFNDTFKCDCQPGYYGKYCEYLKQGVYPDWWFKFDRNTNNDGSKPNDATLKPLNNENGKALFSGQPHKSGMYMECNLRCTESIINVPKLWSKPYDIEDGLTIAFWIRLHPGEEERQKDIYAKRTHIISFKYTGSQIAYSNEEFQWTFDVFREEDFMFVNIPMALADSLKWNFIAVTIKSLNITGFVNQQHKSNMGGGENPISPDEGMLQLFHPHTPGIYSIDDFRVWYKALSTDEISKIYNKEKNNRWLP